MLALGGTALAGSQATARLSVEGGRNGYLGVYVDEVTTQKVTQLNLPGEYGVIVSSVAENSPADKAGLKENDVILEFNSVRVEGAMQFGRLVSETPPGRAVTLKIFRDGKRMDLKATIGSRETVFHGPDLRNLRIPIPEVRIPPVTVTVSGLSALGVSVQSLSKQLGDYFGVTDGHGALITSVRADTPAERAGLRAGDVIVAVDDSEVTGPSSLSRALSRKEGDVSLTILRDKQKQTVRVNLEKRERGDRRFFFDNDAISEWNFDFDWDFDYDFNYHFFDVIPETYMFDLEQQRRSVEDLLRQYQDGVRLKQRRLVDQLRQTQQRMAKLQYAEQARKSREQLRKQSEQLRLLERKRRLTPSYKRPISTPVIL
jgi:serine protease Do